MRTVRVIYRQESDGAWIGTSPEVPGYVGYGDSFDQARDRIREGLPWFAEEDLVIVHLVAPPQAEAPATAGRVGLDITRQFESGYRVGPVGSKPVN